LALHNYHDVYKSFPSGWIVVSTDGVLADDTPSWGWTAMLLPFFEQKPLHDQLRVKDVRLDYWSSTNWSTGNPTGQQLLQTGIDSLMCPSSKSRETNPSHNVSGHDVGTSNYPGVKGLRNGQGTNNNLKMTTVQKCWGILSGNSDIKFADITDGTSNTFAIGERQQDTGNGAIWAGINTSATGNAGNVVGAVCFKLNGIDSPTVAFNSEHPGGGNFAMCDGSVRFISETIEFDNGGKTSNYGADWDGTGANVWMKTALDPPGFPQNLGIYQLLGMYEDGVPIKSF
jgi:prepilin-type processing-associated H-X9-DG protein